MSYLATKGQRVTTYDPGALQIATDRGEDAEAVGPGHHNNICAKSAISRVQEGAREAAPRRRLAAPPVRQIEQERVGSGSAATQGS